MIIWKLLCNTGTWVIKNKSSYIADMNWGKEMPKTDLPWKHVEV